MLHLLFLVYCVQLCLAGYGINGTQYPDTNRGYGPCTTNIFSDNGLIDLQAMLYNCSANMQSALLNPRYG
jgi:hypothetical protein